MSFPKRAPSKALLSNLTKSTRAATVFRTAAGRQLRWQSTEKTPADKPAGDGRSFKGQLYQSTSVRLAREREERQRFSRERNEGAEGRNMALTFGIASQFPPSLSREV
jgi:D-lactate dehydrogenase (cytochrome)